MKNSASPRPPRTPAQTKEDYHDASAATSAGIGALRSRSDAFAAVSSSASARRPARTTVLPAPLRANAAARPTPQPAPVTMAIFRSVVISSLLYQVGGGRGASAPIPSPAPPRTPGIPVRSLALRRNMLAVAEGHRHDGEHRVEAAIGRVQRTGGNEQVVVPPHPPPLVGDRGLRRASHAAGTGLVLPARESGHRLAAPLLHRARRRYPLSGLLEHVPSSAHRLRMGSAPETSVTDQRGRVRGHDNLFVADGSLHPTNGGFDPVLTIMAMAFRNGEHIA